MTIIGSQHKFPTSFEPTFRFGNQVSENLVGPPLLELMSAPHWSDSLFVICGESGANLDNSRRPNDKILDQVAARAQANRRYLMFLSLSSSSSPLLSSSSSLSSLASPNNAPVSSTWQIELRRKTGWKVSREKERKEKMNEKGSSAPPFRKHRLVKYYARSEILLSAGNAML